MAQTIKIKRSGTSGNKLTGSNSVAGEIGMNTADKALYIQTGSADGDVVTVAHESTLKIDEVNNRVGIGTTSPTVPLHVNGFARFSDIQLTGTNPQVAAINNTSLVFKTNNTEVARFDASGNLGIGETTPSAPLHIGGDGRVAIFGDSSFDDKYIELREGGTTGFRMGLRTNLVDSSGCILLQTGDDKGFGIAVNTTADWGSVATSSIPFYVAEGGSVGIGTTSPTYHFHVDAGNNSTTALFESDGVANVVVSGGTNRGSFVVQHSGTTSGALIAKSGGGLEFGVGANYATNVGMTLTSDGDFGIGETSPDRRLHVKDSTLVVSKFESSNSGGVLIDLENAAVPANHAGAYAGIRFYNSSGFDMALSHITESTGNGYVQIGQGWDGTSTVLKAHSSGAVTFNDAFTFPTAIGTAGQVLKVPTSGTTLYWADDNSSGTGTSISDADGDTKIQVEESADEDKIRFDTANSQRMIIDSNGRVGINVEAPSQLLHVGGGAVRATGASADDSLVLQLGQMETSGNPMWSIYSDDVGTDKLEFTTTRWGASYYWTRGSAAGSRVNMMQLNRLSAGDKHWSELSLWTQADATATGSTTTTKDIAFNAGSSSYIKGGSLGIGTTSPSYDLDVHTTTGTGLRVKDDNGWATIRVEGGGDTDNVLELANFGSAGSGSLIRTTGTGHLRLYSGNTEAIRIDGTTQNVGVGETTPSAVLHVTTDADADGIIIQRNSTTGGTSAQLGFMPSTNSSGTPNLWIKGIRGAGSYNDNYMTFGTNSLERMRINAAGNIGIGTTSPTSELQVGDGTTNATIKAYYSDNTYAELAGYGVQFNRSTSYLRPTTNGDKQLEIGGSSLNWNKIINWADTSFLFSGGGNVGIGSSDPQAVLDLGNATNGRGIAWGGGSGTSHYNTIWSEYSTASIIIGAGLKGATNSATFLNPFTGTYGYAAIELDSFSDDGIKFYTGADAARTKNVAITPTEQMRLDNSGRLGIGTSSPSQKLQVEGNVKLDNGSHITWSNTNSSDGRVKIEGDESLDRILLKVDNSNAKVINLTTSGVGIGSTTTPSYNLDVTGTGRFTGAVTLDSTLAFSNNTATDMLNLSNNNIYGVNNIRFSDPGPNEGLQWTNTKIYESPDDLSTNSAGNLQLVYNDTRRLTVNNTGIDVNGTITGANNISKKAATTATGGTGTEDGTNTWAKLATYSTTQNYSDASFVYSVVTEEQGSTSAGIITVQVRWYDISGSNNPELKISWVGLNSGATLDYQSFKLINDGVAEDIELWVQKKSTYSEVELWETAYNKEGAVTVTYETNSAWQSSTPTGTAVNVTSGPLTFDGKEVIVGDNFVNSSNVKIEGVVEASSTGDAYIVINSDTDNSGEASSWLRFSDDDTTRWEWGKNSAGDIKLNRYNTSGVYQDQPITVSVAGLTTLKDQITRSAGVTRLLGTSGVEGLTVNADANIGIGTTSPTQYINTSSTYFRPDSSGKFLTINGGGNGSFIMLESTSNTNGDQIGGLYFTDGTGQSDAHRQVAGIDAVVSEHSTNDSLDGADLRFFTKPLGGGASDPRMTIRANGNIGINTSPSYKLDVNSGTGNTAARFVSTDATTNLMLQDNTGTTYFSSSAGNAYFGGSAGLHANNLTLVQSTGNVGIGDYTPNFKLHVNSGTTNVAATFESSDNEAWIQLRDDGAGAYGCLLGFDSDNNNLFKIADSSVDVKFSLKSSGRVGIGIEDPTEMLEVYTNGDRSVVRIHEDAGSDVARLHLRTGGNDTHIQNHPSTGFEIRTENNLVNADPALRIQGGGNATFGYDVKIKELGIDTTETSTSATTQVAIDSFAAATFRSARYTIQVTNSTDSTYHITEILLIHNGTTPQITEYGTIFTGSAEATFDADISSGNVRLLATPATSDSMTFKVVRHCITV